MNEQEQLGVKEVKKLLEDREASVGQQVLNIITGSKLPLGSMLRIIDGAANGLGYACMPQMALGVGVVKHPGCMTALFAAEPKPSEDPKASLRYACEAYMTVIGANMIGAVPLLEGLAAMIEGVHATLKQMGGYKDEGRLVLGVMSKEGVFDPILKEEAPPIKEPKELKDA